MSFALGWSRKSRRALVMPWSLRKASFSSVCSRSMGRAFLMIVAATADVLVQGQGALSRFGIALLIEAVLQDGDDAPIGESAILRGAGAGALDALVGVRLAQPHHAEAGAKALLGMRPPLHDLLDEQRGLRADALGPGDDALGGPLGVLAMRPRHVRDLRSVLVLVVAAGMAGHAQVAVEHLHRRLGGAEFELLVGERVRDRVIMVVEFDVIVDVRPDYLPFGQLIGPLRQGEERFALELLEERAPRAADLLHRLVVELL